MRTHQYHGIPIRWTSQQAAKSFLRQSMDEISLQPYDEQQFDSASRLVTTAEPCHPNSRPSPALEDKSDLPCFAYIGHVLSMPGILPCTKIPCKYAHLSLEDINARNTELIAKVQSSNPAKEVLSVV